MTFIQVEPKPSLYVNGGGANYLSATTLTGLVGTYRDSTNVYDIVVSSSVVVDTGAVGLNGLDTGTLAASTWYALHAIGSTNNSKLGGYILSTSATAPTLPEGYDVFKVVRWFRTSSGTQFHKVDFCGSTGKVVVARYDLDTTTSGVLIAGAATTYTAVSLAGLVPTTSKLAMLQYAYTPQAAGNKATFRVTGSSISIANTPQYVAGQVATVQIAGDLTVNLNASQQFDYAVGNAGDALTLYLKGYVDFI